MVSSKRDVVLGLLVAGLCACSAGVGTGSVTGVVSAESCGISADEPFDLRADYFVAEAFLDTLNIRVQHGGDEFDYSNVLFVSVVSASEIEESLLGTPIAVGDGTDTLVRMSLALNESCDFHDRTSIPVSYQAVSGTITFTEIYAPEVSDDPLTEATFENVHLVDPSSPDTRYADLSGDFRFIYTRGRPAQVFP